MEKFRMDEYAASEEAAKMTEKISSGEASNYNNAERLVEMDKASERLVDDLVSSGISPRLNSPSYRSRLEDAGYGWVRYVSSWTKDEKAIEFKENLRSAIVNALESSNSLEEFKSNFKFDSLVEEVTREIVGEMELGQNSKAKEFFDLKASIQNY